MTRAGIDEILPSHQNRSSINLDDLMAMTNGEPTMRPNIKRPKTGFNDYAERLNGRAAMVGFVAVILIELFTGQGFLTWMGWR